jgi:hypothetical protein
MFRLQLRVIVGNMSKNCFQLHLVPRPAHFQLLKQIYYLDIYIYIYTQIIYSIFCINQHQHFFWTQKKFQHRDSDLDQFR